jgi:hypothetical protein
MVSDPTSITLQVDTGLQECTRLDLLDHHPLPSLVSLISSAPSHSSHRARVEMSCSQARILLSPSHRNHLSSLVIRSPVLTSHGLTPSALVADTFPSLVPERATRSNRLPTLVPLSSLYLSSGARPVGLINERADILGNLVTGLFSSGSLTFHS